MKTLFFVGVAVVALNYIKFKACTTAAKIVAHHSILRAKEALETPLT